MRGKGREYEKRPRPPLQNWHPGGGQLASGTRVMSEKELASIGRQCMVREKEAGGRTKNELFTCL